MCVYTFDMCVGIKVYICTHIYRNSCVYACGIYMYVCVHTHVHTRIRFTYVYARIPVACVCVYVCVFVCTYTCTHRYTHLAYKALTSTYIMCMSYDLCVREHTHIQIYRNLWVYTYDIYVRVCAYTCTHVYDLSKCMCVYLWPVCVHTHVHIGMHI